jgi:Flp pilus assembly protein TadG
VNVSIRPSSGQRGQDAVEFALIIPVLFLILMGIFDMGRATYYISALHNAAREGARYGIIFPDDTEGIQDRAKEFAVAIPEDELVVTVDFPVEDHIQVTVEWSMPIVTPVIGALFGGENTVPLGSQALMKIEN